MSFALSPPRWPFTLEKWYVDVLCADGTVLLVYLGQLYVGGVRMARLTADLFTPDGVVRHGAARVRTIVGSDDILACGPASITGQTLRFATDGLSGELTYEPRFAGFAAGAPFLRHLGRELRWQVEVPDADVHGSVRWPGGELTVEGRGYRDRVFLDLWPPTPLRELAWGRAACGEHAATWVRAGLKDRVVAYRWCDGELEAAEGPNAELADSRVLLQTAVVDLDGLALGPIKPLLRRLTNDPRETKWTAAARIGAASGRAIHEVVRWR